MPKPKKSKNTIQEQTDLLKENGLIPGCWRVIDDQPDHMTVLNRITCTVKVLDKKVNAPSGVRDRKRQTK